MSEDLVRADRKLTPANENPWYVLMTLYGEQEEYYFENQELNRRAWNAWACQAMSEQERVRAAKAAGVTVEELSAWPLLKDEIEKLHKDEFQKRNENILYPGIVYNGMEGKFIALLSNLHFTNYLRINQFIFSEGASFSSSKFDKQLWAEQTVFCGSAWFGSCQFLQDADFLKVEFYQNADFPICEFLGPSSFTNITVGSSLIF